MSNDTKLEDIAKALILVLNRVDNCHDCWNASASEKEKEFFNKALNNIKQVERDI